MDFEAERQEVFRCLFHGYLEMFRREFPGSDISWFGPNAKWLAAMYAVLNTSLWETGKKKLKKGG
jgi:hypothetical protein